MAIKEAVKYWQHWHRKALPGLLRSQTIVKNEYKSKKQEELGDLTYFLSQFDFEIIYHPGSEKLEADCLSKNPVSEIGQTDDETLKVVNHIKIKDIIEDQKNNKFIKNEKDKTIFKDNIYNKKSGKRNKIIISEEFSKKLIQQTHKDFCHIGINQMKTKLMPYYMEKT
ncbi:hypothetical protein HHI36_002491 [Cryptolaemus montrouzieri]|uniref:Integrase zinc-binding domain-containing protein n=1 Tax=Cryptolaemus montrouzieri TaxID=559131 RepID=A0ABD2PB49_9CUCU